MTLIVALAIAGLLLILAEFLLPGMIAGIIGVICLIGAAVATFFEFGPMMGIYVFMGEIILGIIAFVFWIKYLPNSSLGKIFALKQEVPEQTSASKRYEQLIGQTGKTISPLRPSGIAEINGQRHDVVSEGTHLEIGTQIKIVKVEGARIVVRPEQYHEN
jgi:membrane-bound serine protease (ClpP class)